MRIYKSLHKDRHVVVTLSLWGDDELFTEHAEELLTELLEEIKNK